MGKNWVQIDRRSYNCRIISKYTLTYFLHKRIGNLNFLLPYFEGCRPCPFFCYYFGCICCSIFVFCYYCWWPSLHVKVSINKSHGDPFLYNRIWDLGWSWTGLQYWKLPSLTCYCLFLKTLFYVFLMDCHNSDVINSLFNVFRFRQSYRYQVL